MTRKKPVKKLPPKRKPELPELTYEEWRQYQCRACGKTLVLENYRLADGCPCNSPRGVNHGLVPLLTCTCVECDPEQTGSTRYSPVSGG